MSYQQVHARINPALYEALKLIAKKQKTSLNKIIELILSKYIEEHRKQQLSREIDEYIDKTAENSGEFTAEFDATVTRKLLEETEW